MAFLCLALRVNPLCFFVQFRCIAELPACACKVNGVRAVRDHLHFFKLNALTDIVREIQENFPGVGDEFVHNPGKCEEQGHEDGDNLGYE